MKPFDFKNTMLPRTKEGTLFEIAFAALAILVWTYIILQFSKAPDIVPTHFGVSGTPDAYGSKWGAMLPNIIISVMGLCCLLGAYYPQTVNLPGVKATNARQSALCARMMRTLALLMLVLTAAIAADTLRGHILLVMLTVAAIVVLCIVFTFLIYRAR